MTLWQRWKQTALHNKALVLTGAIVAFGTTFYSCAAIKQTSILKQSSDQTAGQNEKLIAQAKLQAQAAVEFSQSAASIDTRIQATEHDFERMAKSAEQNTKEAQDRFRKDERPYVWLSDPKDVGDPQCKLEVQSIKLVDGSRAPLRLCHVYWSYGFKNYGKTPANNVELSKVVLTGQDARSKKWVWPEIRHAPPLAPGMPYFTGVLSEDWMPEDVFKHRMNMDGELVVRGRIRYTDAGGTQYETGYCFLHMGIGGNAYCEESPNDNYIK